MSSSAAPVAPSGLPLLHFRVPPGTWHDCSLCMRILHAGATLFRCAPDDYDLCPYCHQAAEASARQSGSRAQPSQLPPVSVSSTLFQHDSTASQPADFPAQRAPQPAQHIGNYREVDIAGDGHCMYRSVLVGLWCQGLDGYDGETVDTARAAVAHELRRRGRRIEAEAAERGIGCEIVDEDAWGGDLELEVMAHICQIRIVVFERFEGQDHWHPTEIGRGDTEVVLKNYGNVHFSLLVHAE
eukprot:SAG31_NODE_1535_length_7971_cov_7.118438_1_plen_241_part_00